MERNLIMKNKFFAVIFSVLLISLMCTSAFAEELDLSANTAEDAYAEIGEGIYEVNVSTHPRIKGSLESGLSFGVYFSFRELDWININLANEATFPEKDNSYLGNKGVNSASPRRRQFLHGTYYHRRNNLGRSSRGFRQKGR